VLAVICLAPQFFASFKIASISSSFSTGIMGSSLIPTGISPLLNLSTALSLSTDEGAFGSSFLSYFKVVTVNVTHEDISLSKSVSLKTILLFVMIITLI